MIYLKQKTLGGNIVIDRFDSDRMLKATYRLVQIRKKKTQTSNTHISWSKNVEANDGLD